MVFAAWVRCVPEQAGRVGGVDTRTGVVCVWRGGRTRAPRMASVKAWTGARPRSLSLPPTPLLFVYLLLAINPSFLCLASVPAPVRFCFIHSFSLSTICTKKCIDLKV